MSAREPASASSASAVVIFDFDGTLVSRDSFLDFSLRYCLRRPARLPLLVALLPLALISSFRSLSAGGSVLLWAMTVGASTRSFVVALRRYARSTLPRFAHEAVFAELARHRRDGRSVVIATGSLPLLVRGLLHRRQLAPLPVVGSRLRRRFGGLTVDTHCIGRNKPRELERRLGLAAWHAVYTDSFTDRHLLSRASDVTLVAPARLTLRRARDLLGERAPLRVLWPS